MIKILKRTRREQDIVTPLEKRQREKLRRSAIVELKRADRQRREDEEDEE